MTDTKLDPATLSATVREVARGIKVGFDRNGEISQTHLLDWIMAMTALFAPATEKGASVIVGSHHWFDPVIGRVVSEVITEPAPPATEKRSTDPDCGPYTHHWDFGFCHTCKKPGRDQGDAPATEKAVCPNCGEATDTGLGHRRIRPIGEDRYICQPAQPEPDVRIQTMEEAMEESLRMVRGEPAAQGKISELDDRHNRMASPEYQAKVKADMGRRAVEIGMERLVGVASIPVSEAVTVGSWQLEELLKYADLAEVALRTGFHPPEFLFTPADRSLRQCIDAIKKQRDEWRARSQPVAHPFKAGFKPDSMRHFAEYVRDNWHYFGTDTAGLAHQFLQEMAAQPVAVGMTEELSMVLLRAEYGATEDERNPNLRDGYVARLKSAIETVRQQAAQVKL